MTDAARDLVTFADRGVSPFHAVAEMARRLDDGGFARIEEQDRWRIAAGDRC